MKYIFFNSGWSMISTPYGVMNWRGPPGAMHRGCGSSLPSVSSRYCTSSFAHGWNGAILSISDGFTRNAPVIGIGFSERLPGPVFQYPFSPGGGPRFTRPSDQCGVGFDGGFARPPRC